MKVTRGTPSTCSEVFVTGKNGRELSVKTILRRGIHARTGERGKGSDVQFL